MILAYLLFLNFIGDWILQSPKMGKEKSEKKSVLFSHIGIIFATLFFGGIIFVNPEKMFLIAVINTALHGIIDWNIWNLYKYSIKYRHPDKSMLELKQEYETERKYAIDPFFGYILGFDQLLHVVILVISVDFIGV